MSAALKTGATVFAGAAVASAASGPTVEASVWHIVVLGIPLGVLGAALAGAATRYLREPPEQERHIVPKLVGTLTDGFVGGWLAMLLLGLPSTRDYVGDIVPPEVVGALCALAMQFLRTKVPEWADTAAKNVLSWFGNRSGR